MKEKDVGAKTLRQQTTDYLCITEKSKSIFPKVVLFKWEISS